MPLLERRQHDLEGFFDLLPVARLRRQLYQASGRPRRGRVDAQHAFVQPASAVELGGQAFGQLRTLQPSARRRLWLRQLPSERISLALEQPGASGRVGGAAQPPLERETHGRAVVLLTS